MIARRLLLGAGLAGLVLAPRPAAAHRAKAALTLVRWNARTRLLELEHRLHAHDAELALNRQADVASPDLSRLEQRARLALYVEARFALLLPDGVPLALTTLGAELDADNVLVFQEAAMTDPPSALTVRNDILRDVFRTQVNQVNFDLKGGDPAFIRTVTFSGEDREEMVRFAG